MYFLLTVLYALPFISSSLYSGNVCVSLFLPPTFSTSQLGPTSWFRIFSVFWPFPSKRCIDSHPLAISAPSIREPFSVHLLKQEKKAGQDDFTTDFSKSVTMIACCLAPCSVFTLFIYLITPLCPRQVNSLSSPYCQFAPYGITAQAKLGGMPGWFQQPILEALPHACRCGNCSPPLLAPGAASATPPFPPG